MQKTSARLLALLSLLQSRRDWPGDELAARLDVSTRTVRRDVDRLRELGYPVTAVKGPDGGYRLGTGAQLPPLLFDDDQAVALAVALQTATVTGAGIGEAAARALTTLRQVLPARLRHRIAAFQVTAVAPPGADPVQADSRVLMEISTAIHAREELRFDYVPAHPAVRGREGEVVSRGAKREEVTRGTEGRVGTRDAGGGAVSRGGKREEVTRGTEGRVGTRDAGGGAGVRGREGRGVAAGDAEDRGDERDPTERGTVARGAEDRRDERNPTERGTTARDAEDRGDQRNPAARDTAGRGEGAGAVVRRRVLPHHLVTWRGRWYLLAWDLDRDDWRTFRADRVSPRTPTGPRFTPREVPGGDVAAFVAGRFRGMDGQASRLCRGEAVLDVPAATVAPYVHDGLVEELGSGRCRVVLDSWSWTGLAAAMSRFDAVPHDVRPAELREAFAVLARRCAVAAGGVEEDGVGEDGVGEGGVGEGGVEDEGGAGEAPPSPGVVSGACETRRGPRPSAGATDGPEGGP
ncbi:hypothetical protein GCM10010259_04600 [Streptomyces daghestanicus]|uniref:HTH deoR-type domain-containing protein n=1 Tax=Streptomyces daghestanicus TaxID=66885 RepID=A0ABQ3QDT2_9ACTN|nr:WYL domain-containing protein [Streptomyces daghestanicus]GGU17150.1 hypothetical protein GCM10010259_04600 [Streptomyces daghestanicus]GHI35441.1 hypothetical protein Sdagh_71710 [Streptomyces daghestanicus]